MSFVPIFFVMLQCHIPIEYILVVFINLCYCCHTTLWVINPHSYFQRFNPRLMRLDNFWFHPFRLLIESMRTLLFKGYEIIMSLKRRLTTSLTGSEGSIFCFSIFSRSSMYIEIVVVFCFVIFYSPSLLK